MPEVVIPESVENHHALIGPLTVRTATQTHASLIEAIRSTPSVRIDCGAATEMDLSFIQLVLAARKSAEAAGKSLTLAAPASGVLLDRLSQAGLVASADAPPVPGQAFWLQQGEA
jgi:ABC-type transporter Mla MlaB component